MYKIINNLLDILLKIKYRIRVIPILFIRGILFRKIGSNCKIIGLNYMSIGKGLSLGDNCWLEAVYRFNNKKYSPQLVIGSYVSISDSTHISVVHDIYIGNSCLLGSHIYIGDHSHGSTYDYVSIISTPPAKRDLLDISKIYIGENTWICDGAVILAGSHIPSHSIVAANSVCRLKADRPALIAGIPARIIRYLD